jgi:hypothetical protein
MPPLMRTASHLSASVATLLRQRELRERIRRGVEPCRAHVVAMLVKARSFERKCTFHTADSPFDPKVGLRLLQGLLDAAGKKVEVGVN